MKDCFIVDTAHIVMIKYFEDDGGAIISYMNSKGCSLMFVSNVQWTKEFIICERDIPQFYA